MRAGLSIHSLLVALACLTLLGGCSTPGSYGPARGPGNIGVVSNASAGPRVDISISVGQARELAVANRLTGRRALPPGIARNLARGKPLPPGIQRQVLPDAMLAGLPRIDGHEWRIAGTDLVLVALGTLLVVELLEDVFR